MLVLPVSAHRTALGAHLVTLLNQHHRTQSHAPAPNAPLTALSSRAGRNAISCLCVASRHYPNVVTRRLRCRAVMGACATQPCNGNSAAKVDPRGGTIANAPKSGKFARPTTTGGCPSGKKLRRPLRKESQPLCSRVAGIPSAITDIFPRKFGTARGKCKAVDDACRACGAVL
jgi:hypothetical protein